MSQICENYHEKHPSLDVCLLKKKWGGILGLSFPVTPPSFGLKPPGSVHQGWFLVPKLINGNFLQEISLFPHPSNPLPFVLCAKCAWYICGARPSNKGGKLVLWRRCLVTWEHSSCLWSSPSSFITKSSTKQWQSADSQWKQARSTSPSFARGPSGGTPSYSRRAVIDQRWRWEVCNISSLNQKDLQRLISTRISNKKRHL